MENDDLEVVPIYVTKCLGHPECFDEVSYDDDDAWLNFRMCVSNHVKSNIMTSQTFAADLNQNFLNNLVLCKLKRKTIYEIFSLKLLRSLLSRKKSTIQH